MYRIVLVDFSAEKGTLLIVKTYGNHKMCLWKLE